MAGIRGKNTKPELQVRKMLHTSGLRYRLHDPNLPGRPDLVMKKYRVAVLVQGCFWHGHNDCPLFRLPKSRTEFWTKKIARNVDRDQENLSALEKLDWRVLNVWECALKGSNRMESNILRDQMIKFITASEVSFLDIRGTAKVVEHQTI